MENKELNTVPEIEQEENPAVEENIEEAVAQQEPVAASAEEAPVAEENAAEAAVEEMVEATAEEAPEAAEDVVDTESIREYAEEFEADWLTVAPIGEAPEIPVEKVSAAKRIKEYFGSIRWKRTWDKICLGLLIFLIAIPILALIYVLTYFF